MRNVTKVSNYDKLEFISRNQLLFKDLAHYRRLCKEAGTYPKLIDDMRKLARLIRLKFNYSGKTGDFDLASSWLYFYENSIFYNISVIDKIKVSKKFDHEKLEERIRKVFKDIDYKEYHKMLAELFPEIRKAISEEAFREVYKIGNAYVRIGQTDGCVKSLVMPVVMGYKDGTIGNQQNVRLLNLIAGNFWIGSAFVDNISYPLSEEDWAQLTSFSKDHFIRLGWFSHDHLELFLCGQDDYKIKLFTGSKLNDAANW